MFSSMNNNEIPSCCKIDAVVSVDARGQILLPKDVRQKAGIVQGDKLMVISCEDENKVCCLSLIKIEGSNELVKNMLGPMLKSVFKEE